MKHESDMLSGLSRFEGQLVSNGRKFCLWRMEKRAMPGIFVASFVVTVLWRSTQELGLISLNRGRATSC